MTKFQASIYDLLQDLYRFINETLQNEILTSSALTHKESLLCQMKDLNQKYPELQLTFLNDHKDSTRPSSRNSPTSPVPYVDMNCGSPYKLPSVLKSVEDENYDLCVIKERVSGYENHSLTESEDYHSEEAEKSFDIAACDLHSCEKSGFLDKKRESIKGWLNPFQKRWCAIKDGILYYYEKSSDRKQKGSITLCGYEARPVTDINKDGKKYNHCFELVCPGRRTYQFIAPSEKDLKQWIAAVEKNSEDNAELNITKNPKELEKKTDLGVPDSIPPSSEDIYEIVDDDKITSSEENLTDGITKETSYNEDLNQQNYSDGESVISNQIFNYQEWYVGLWDCIASEENELSFLRGDLIHILDKEYDSLAWWIGEHGGKIGFVPKSYLMEAYEAC